MNDPIRYGTANEKELLDLWTDPTEAPHVPPPSMLSKYIEDPSAFKEEQPDLADQIENCPLTSKAIQWSKEAEDFEIPPAPAPKPSATSIQTELADTQSSAPAAGDLCATSTHLPYWNGTRSLTRTSFDPPEVLLLQHHEATSEDPEYWEAIPVMPTFCMPEESSPNRVHPFKTNDGLEYVALLDLARPLHPLQLRKVLASGCVGKESLQKLTNILPKGSLEDLLQEPLSNSFWLREKARCSQLDAQFKHDEEARNFFRSFMEEQLTQSYRQSAYTVLDNVMPQIKAASTEGLAHHKLLMLSELPKACIAKLGDRPHSEGSKLLPNGIYPNHLRL